MANCEVSYESKKTNLNKEFDLRVKFQCLDYAKHTLDELAGLDSFEYDSTGCLINGIIKAIKNQ